MVQIHPVALVDRQVHTAERRSAWVAPRLFSFYNFIVYFFIPYVILKYKSRETAGSRVEMV